MINSKNERQCLKCYQICNIKNILIKLISYVAMCLCVCLCVCVCVYVCVYVCVCVIYAYIYIYLFIYLYIYTYVHWHNNWDNLWECPKARSLNQQSCIMYVRQTSLEKPI